MPSAPHTHQNTRQRHMAIYALLICAVLALAWVAVLYVDQPVAEADRAWTRAPIMRAMLDVATWLGNWQLGPLLIALALIAARDHWRRMFKTIVTAYFLRTVTVEWLKLMLGRPRPRDLVDATALEGFGGGASFPSGHAAFSFMFAVIIAAWFPRWKVPAYIFAMLISLSRVVVNAHYVSDIIVGAVVGTLFAWLALWMYHPVTERNREAIEAYERRRREERSDWAASDEGCAAAERARGRTPMALAVLVAVAATVLAFLYIDPIPGFHDAPVLQTPAVQWLAQAGRLLGTWELAPLLFALALLAAHRRWRSLLAAIFAGYALQTGVTEGIKWLVGRPRPSQLPEPWTIYGPGTEFHSFPSGHASFAFMFATVVGAYLPRARWALYLLATFIAACRIPLRAHNLSDVLFCALIGVLALLLVLMLLPPRPVAQEEAEIEESVCAGGDEPEAPYKD